MVPDFDSITGESYHQLFTKDSILCRDVDEMTENKLLSKQDLSVLKRLIVKFRLHLKESNENVEKFGAGDILLDHAVFISDLMIKRIVSLQVAAKHEKDKNNRSENFMATVGLFKKGLIAFERQQESLRRHLARIIYSNTEEGAAYFKEKAREEMAEVIRERVEEYRRKEAELEAQEKEKVGSKSGVTKLEVIEEEVKEN
ncbi:hypothetical protein GCK72_025030 [Caenorhabditis remanei]|uniref:Uncharacterized protein n=1 Tax=Caenorhabditis remanei TaxID=31234 RepID=A0A6A5G193_CAERE|nr:hypothetical protein GCK72_025030 [Caenorhabditis remanei]KAF1748563.1 hypothetical protein GCK72_025030 [Caenorhabditis remanei]